MKYDYLVVGSGLYGAIFAHEAKAKGKSVLVVDKRPNIAGNVYTEKQEGINVHMYGAHIFHTNDKRVWNYITQFAEFNRFTNSPVANYKGELYSMPFNMYTFNKMWGVVTPEEAAAKIEEQKKEITGEPKNLEEQAISLVGRDIYEKLVKGYTEKQWGRDCKELPAFIIKRLPVRLTFDNNYFNALYQGIPIGGYTKMVENLLDGIEVRLNTDYLEHKAELDALADKVVYTGPIDAYFGFKLGTLEYRSVRFENETLDIPNFQGNAAVNYTDRETPWTRIIEHKWFEFGKDEDGNDLPKTIISREYSSEWKAGDEPYYPVNDRRKTDSSMLSTRSLPIRRPVLYSVVVSASTSTMIWILPLLLYLICVIRSLANSQASHKMLCLCHTKPPIAFATGGFVYIIFFRSRFISAAGICSLRHSYPYSFEYAYTAGSCLDRKSAGASVTEYAPQCPNSRTSPSSSFLSFTSLTSTSATVHKLPQSV